jgi:hypothetical protein
MPGLSVLTSVTRVDIYLFNNVWWTDAFQFGEQDDTTWSFAGKSFILDVKMTTTDALPLLSLTSVAGFIVVDDPVLRILHMEVDDHTIRNSLPVNELATPELDPYVYDLIMVDDVSGERMMLMYGQLQVYQGVTIED